MSIKRFLILSVLAVMSVASYACYVEPVIRYYIYYLPENSQSWEDRKMEGLVAAWSSLLGIKVTEDDVFLLSMIDENDDWSVLYNDIVRKCMDGRHNAELEYLMYLVKYFNKGQLSFNAWEYPTKAEIENRERFLKSIQAHAVSISGRLAPQYRLLNMRCAFSLGKWQDVITQWEAYPKDDSIFTEMMRNLYAGALYRVGRTDEAFVIYSEQGDALSASWCVANTPLVTGIESFYKTDPNSPVLPYLLKRFCDNTQETIDVLEDLAGEEPGSEQVKECLRMIGAREINRENAEKFVSFAESAAANPQVKDAAMWLNAAALVNYYYGNAPAAKKLLRQAGNSRNTEASRFCSEYIGLFVDFALADSAGDKSRLALKAINRLRPLMDGGELGDTYPERMMIRLVYAVLQPEFTRCGMYNELLAAMAVLCERDKLTGSQSCLLYGDEYFRMLDAMPVSKLVEWKEFVGTNNPSDGWNQLARKYCRAEKNFLNDLIGTRYLRQGKTAEARKYLSEVSLSFLSRQNIAPYAAVRSFTDIPWFAKVEPVDTGRKVTFTRNPKLAYCDYLDDLRKKVERTGSSDNLVRLAAAYYNASESGKCWWLTRYKASLSPDTVKAPDFDYALQSDRLLEKAKTAKGTVTKMAILYAQAFIAPGELYHKWSDEVNRASQAFFAYSNLAQAVSDLRGRMPAYISQCETFNEFMVKR